MRACTRISKPARASCTLARAPANQIWRPDASANYWYYLGEVPYICHYYSRAGQQRLAEFFWQSLSKFSHSRFYRLLARCYSKQNRSAVKNVPKILVLLFLFMSADPFARAQEGGDSGGDGAKKVEVPKMRQNKAFRKGKNKNGLFDEDKKGNRNDEKWATKRATGDKKEYRKLRRKQQRPKTTRRMRRSDRKAKKVNNNKNAPLLKRAFKKK